MPSRSPNVPRRAAAALLGVALGLTACGAKGASGDSSATSGARAHGATTTDPGKTGSTASTSTTSTTFAVHPVGGKVTVLEIGDSLGIDLGWGMQWALTNDSTVNLVQDAKGDTGLVNSTQAVHPQIVVVFLGANDVQNFYQGNQYVSFGTALWRHAYGARVATMMDEATSAGAKVLWVGMPIMQPQPFSSNISQLDSVYQSEARTHRGVTFFSSWSLFATPSGQFNGGTTDVAGSQMSLRDPDGIHLADGGEDLLGLDVVKEMKAIYRLP
jgi:hypothetical protein